MSGTDESSMIPQEQPCATCMGRKIFSIGLPACTNPSERRFPLTPEAVKILVERGFRVCLQEGAAASIHYTDNQYLRAGAEVADRNSALGCDIVIHLAAPAAADVRKMRRGAMLMTLLHAESQDPEAIRQLLDRRIIAIAVDLIEDEHGNTPFADILAEIDGRASLAVASSLLADGTRGKGILLGGISGIIPCETTIIGSGISACAAARSAMGLGSTVKMFDNDVYRLRRASMSLGPWAITSAIHPKVVESALRSADVVVVTPTAEPFRIDSDLVDTMKKGVLAFDLSSASGDAFPSLKAVDLARASALNAADLSHGRLCFVNAGSAVARTAAMALSNTFISLMSSIISCEGAVNALKLQPGIQRATYTFFGKVVNAAIGRAAGMRHTDISIYLTLS
jgi:Alanine dehydrogenase